MATRSLHQLKKTKTPINTQLHHWVDHVSRLVAKKVQDLKSTNDDLSMKGWLGNSKGNGLLLAHGTNMCVKALYTMESIQISCGGDFLTSLETKSEVVPRKISDCIKSLFLWHEALVLIHNSPSLTCRLCLIFLMVTTELHASAIAAKLPAVLAWNTSILELGWAVKHLCRRHTVSPLRRPEHQFFAVWPWSAHIQNSATSGRKDGAETWGRKQPAPLFLSFCFVDVLTLLIWCWKHRSQS